MLPRQNGRSLCYFCEIPPVPIYPPSNVKFCQCRGQAKQTLVHPMKIPILPGLHLLATCTVFPKTFQDCAYNELLNKYFKVNSNCRRTPVTSNQPRFVGSLQSINVGTRKMVNYAWPGWSQGKPWWRTVAILTCKSIVGAGYRGERLIEPSSSWFLPKFPSG